jgi:hypothetical protein
LYSHLPESKQRADCTIILEALSVRANPPQAYPGFDKLRSVWESQLQQMRQQRECQGAVNEHMWISLHVACIVRIIVYPMGVPGER